MAAAVSTGVRTLRCRDVFRRVERLQCIEAPSLSALAMPYITGSQMSGYTVCPQAGLPDLAALLQSAARIGLEIHT